MKSTRYRKCDFSMSKDYSFLSIVIVNYNGLNYLRDCVASLLQSEYPFYEIIIVDNGSTDGSVSMIKTVFKDYQNRIIVLDLPNNVGFARANLIGAEKGVGKYILLLNSDTKVEPSSLGQLINAMDKDPLIGVAQAKILLMGKPDTFDCAGMTLSVFGGVHQRGANEKDLGQYDRMEEISCAKGAAMIVRKGVWSDLKGFDPLFFAYSEESDFCWRVWLSGSRVVFVPSAIVYHIGAASTTKLGTQPLSEFLIFQYYRNQIVTFAKNLSAKNLIKYSPGLLGLNLIQVMFHISRNEPMSMLGNLKGVAWCVLFFNKIWEKRLAVQRGRVVNDEDLFKRGAISRRARL
jgi:GT2 family glycosyltransferase